MSLYCTKCGATLNENDPFCGRRGSPTQQTVVKSFAVAGMPQAPQQSVTDPSFPQEVINAPSPQRGQATPQTVFTPLPNIQPLALPSNSGPSAMRVLAVWILLGAIELGMISMLSSLIRELKENIIYEKMGLGYTSDHLLALAYGAGEAGTFWGAVLGGVGGWIKTMRDRRKAP